MAGNGVDHEFNGHEKLTSNEMGSTAIRPKNIVEKDDDLPEYDWEDHRAHQLQALLTNNLLVKFQTAIKQVECGSNEVAASSAVRNYDSSRGADGLRSLAKYFVLEMTNMVLKARPGLTTTEALQRLLESGMDLSKACSVEIGHPPSSSGHQGTI